ncbi:MAG: FG-GAP repeat domain-containing protein [Acidobacteriota bacterium]
MNLLYKLFFCLLLFGVCPAAIDFEAQRQVTLAGAGVGDRIAVGKINGDQHPDLLVSPARSDQAVFQDGLNVVIADGQGGFQEGTAFTVGVQITGLAAADLNGDTILDVAVTEGVRSKGATYAPCGTLKGGVPVFLGNGDGSFAFKGCLVAADVPAAVVAGDFNEDGKADLIVSNASYATGGTPVTDVYFFAGKGDGTFQTGTVILNVYGDDAAAADFNADGHLDLALGSFIFRGRGDGTFTSTGSALPGKVNRLAVGDLNGDGRPDLAAVSSVRQSSTDDLVSYALNDGAGNLAYAGTVPVESHPVGIAISDLNLDGRGDVITANFLANNVTVLISQGNAFEAPQSFPAGLEPMALATGDFNGDGWPDLAVADNNAGQDGTLAILLQRVTAPPPASTRLWFPFYEADALTFTGFAVSNDSVTSARATFLGLDPSGTPLAYATNPRVVDLPPRGQFASLGNEIFAAPSGSVQKGWVEVTSDSFLGSLLMFGSGQQLDGSVGLTQQSKLFYFTEIHEGPTAFRGQVSETLVSIANPNLHAITVKLNLFEASTQQKLAPEATLTLPARGYFCQPLSQAFGQTLAVENGYLTAEVTNGTGAVGFELVRLKTHDTALGLNGLPANQSSAALYSAQFAMVPGFATSLKLLNVGQSARNLVITPLDDQGKPSTVTTLSLSPGAARQLDAAEILHLPASASWVGTLRVEPDGPGIIGDVIFVDSAAFSRASSLPLDNHTFTHAVFSQVYNAVDFYTGLALHNPGAGTAQILVEVYSNQGARTGITSISLQPQARVSQLLPEFMPSTAGQVGGYVVVRSTQPVVAQQLFGSMQVLSAVPATVIQ